MPTAPLCQRACAHAHFCWRFLETFEEPGRHSGQSVKVVVPALSHSGQRGLINRTVFQYSDWRLIASLKRQGGSFGFGGGGLTSGGSSPV